MPYCLTSCLDWYVRSEGHITLDQLDAAMMLLGEEENDASNWILENQHQVNLPSTRLEL